MSSVELQLDTERAESGLVNFSRLLVNLPPQLVADAADITEQEMRIEIPVSSGRLQSSVTSEINGLEASVHTNTGYGKAVDEGRRGLDIYPKNFRFLRFFYNGKIVFAKESHPSATQPNEFTKRTIQNVGNRILSMMDSRIHSELTK